MSDRDDTGLHNMGATASLDEDRHEYVINGSTDMVYGFDGADNVIVFARVRYRDSWGGYDGFGLVSDECALCQRFRCRCGR